MFTPSERWSWHYCPKKDRLLLDLDNNIQFCTELSGSVLACGMQQQPFSVAEAEIFWCLYDALRPLQLDEAVCLELCLHALANRFRQLTAHKSWYFATQRLQDIGPYQLVQLQGKDVLTALVVASDLECIECMLLQNGESLAGKQLHRTSVIRVLRNRAYPLELNVEMARTA